LAYFGHVLTTLDHLQPGKYSGLVDNLQGEAHPSPHHVTSACLDSPSEQQEQGLWLLGD
jgi:hypothetical protein